MDLVLEAYSDYNRLAFAEPFVDSSSDVNLIQHSVRNYQRMGYGIPNETVVVVEEWALALHMDLTIANISVAIEA